MGERDFWELSKASTNPGFGCIPSERSLDELLASGVVLIAVSYTHLTLPTKA